MRCHCAASALRCHYALPPHSHCTALPLCAAHVHMCMHMCTKCTCAGPGWCLRSLLHATHSTPGDVHACHAQVFAQSLGLGQLGVGLLVALPQVRRSMIPEGHAEGPVGTPHHTVVSTAQRCHATLRR